MNYRHIFHAGNFADVFKHWILTLLLEKLCEKPTPFCVIDTHAGLGIYDLKHANAQKTQEYKTGFLLLQDQNPAPEFKVYFDIINEFKTSMDVYPGSPAIIQTFLRANDRLWCAELHPEDFKVLEDYFHGDPRVKVLHQNGYQTIKGVLPPPQGRGLIFVDPPFEVTNEFSQIINALQAGLKRFAHGIYAIWYPIKDTGSLQKFYRDLKDFSVKEILIVELHANTAISNQLGSCGIVVLNPPWQLAEKLQANMQTLLDYLQLSHGSFTIKLY